ncbi:MAG: 2-hydroxyacid dehydrogenase [Pseudomonadota bacterium]
MKPTILVPGNIHPRGRQRLDENFQLHHVQDFKLDGLDAAFAEKIDGIATFMFPIDKPLLQAFPNLKIVSSFGVGYDHVDAASAADLGIVTAHTPEVLDDEVADTTIGLLISTLRELPAAERYLRDGLWKTKGPYHNTPLTLRARTIGIFGMGRIGRKIAKRLDAFDVAIHYHNRRTLNDVSYPYHASLNALATACDTLINVVPSTPETQNAVDAKILKALGPNGVLINVGRGDTVDNEAVAEALTDGTIAAAGIDVFPNEPDVPDALLRAPNTVLLPHVASASVHTRDAMADRVVDNLISWFDGKGAIAAVPESEHLNKSV